LTVSVNKSQEISASDAFSGDKILYSISAPVSNTSNLVMINRKNGIATIKGGAPDKFDVTLSATSPCGTATTTFNVQIVP
jgi:hypothetical protein